MRHQENFAAEVFHGYEVLITNPKPWEYIRNDEIDAASKVIY